MGNMVRNKTSVAKGDSRFDSLEQEAYLNVWRTYDRLKSLEDALFTQFELTPQQYNVLRLLQYKSPAGLQTLQIAARMVSRAPDITRILDWLEDRKWIRRERLADNRRVVEVRITPRGKILLAEIAAPLRTCHRQQLGHLSASKLRQLSMLLRSARHPHEVAGSPWKNSNSEQ